MTSQIVVCPYRFTSQAARVTDFYKLSGLEEVRRSGSGYTVLRGAAGYLAIHPTASARVGKATETHLSFMVPSVEKYLAQLPENVVNLVWWDEAWGQAAGIVDPAGGGIWINEWEHDLYGYEDRLAEGAAPAQEYSDNGEGAEAVNKETAGSHSAGEAGLPKAGGRSGEPVAVEVVMVRYSYDFDADRNFFAKLAFQSAAGACPEWEQMSASKQSGWIGLHYPNAGQQTVRKEDNNPVGDFVPLVSLSLQTTEDLQQLAHRLSEHGYPAQVVTDAAATKVHVTDPDGAALEIHPVL